MIDPKIRQDNRIRALAALGRKLQDLPIDKYSIWDDELDDLCRVIYHLPPRPQGKDPYGWLVSTPSPVQSNLSNNLYDKNQITSQDVQVIPDNVVIPAFQLNRSNCISFTSPVLGAVSVTGGFMEPHGHSRKPKAIAIWDDGSVKELPESDRNLGIDYVPIIGNIRAWYSGIVVAVGAEKGYGLRCHIRYDQPFIGKDGRSSIAFGAYAHAEEIYVKQGQVISQGQLIGIMGSSGGNYPPHVDYRLTTQLDGKLYDVSPNYYDRLFAR